jgi:hypothetical protein
VIVERERNHGASILTRLGTDGDYRKCSGPAALDRRRLRKLGRRIKARRNIMVGERPQPPGRRSFRKVWRPLPYQEQVDLDACST